MKQEYLQVKNIFFDLDDTIIKHEKRDILAYKEALKNCGYDEKDYLKVYTQIDAYEKKFTEKKNGFDRKDLIDFINKTLNKNYSYKLMNELIRTVGKYWIGYILLEEEIVKKLSEKYNLYIYTNFFLESQQKRIELIGYSKYFKKIFASDIYGGKPFKSSFIKILEELNVKTEECIMIGDTKGTDILAANNIGMKSILFDYDGKRDKKEIKAENYIVIKDMKELLEIL